jgi:hypothetical protein
MWSFSVLYNFCSETNCVDGKLPRGGLTYLGAQNGVPYDGVSPLYGTTGAGGTLPGLGVAFQLTRERKRTTEKTIYIFCSVGQTCDDGWQPMGTLLPDNHGNLYGTLGVGTNGNGNGAIFELTPRGSQFTEVLLYNFCSLTNCADGSLPREYLSFDWAGDIVGATWRGGTHDSNDSGIIFRLIPNGINSQLSVLYDFCTKSGCADGEWPSGKVYAAPNGDIIGTTEIGGVNNHGVIFQLHNGVEKVLYRFCRANEKCAYGDRPYYGLISDQTGNLYGTTTPAEAGHGIVFEFSP